MGAVYSDAEKIFECESIYNILALISSLSGRIDSQYYNKEQIGIMLSAISTIRQVATLPTSPIKNSVYYVGTSLPYDVILIDDDNKQINLGTTNINLDDYVKSSELISTVDSRIDATLPTKLADYQKKSDTTLATSSKTVVGAINEVYGRLNANVGFTFPISRGKLWDSRAIKITNNLYYVSFKYNTNGVAVNANTVYRMLDEGKGFIVINGRKVASYQSLFVAVEATRYPGTCTIGLIGTAGPTVSFLVTSNIAGDHTLNFKGMLITE